MTWNARKPSVPVFDKGTTFIMRSPVPICLDKINRIWIGERNMEGYGEICAEKVPEQYKFEIAKAKGVYKGRKPLPIDEKQLEAVYRRWRAGELKAVEAMKLLNLKPNTFYRRIHEYEERQYIDF